MSEGLWISLAPLGTIFSTCIFWIVLFLNVKILGSRERSVRKRVAQSCDLRSSSVDACKTDLRRSQQAINQLSCEQ
jgi:hypothetical protein